MKKASSAQAGFTVSEFLLVAASVVFLAAVSVAVLSSLDRAAQSGEAPQPGALE